MSYSDADDDPSSLVAFACASFVLSDGGDFDSPCPTRPSSPTPFPTAAPQPCPAGKQPPPVAYQPIAVGGEDSVQALIRKVEQESLTSSASPEHRRDVPRRRRADLPPRFRPSTPSHLGHPSPTSTTSASPNRAAPRPFSPTSPESPRGAGGPAYAQSGGRQAFGRQIDVSRANRLASSFGHPHPASRSPGGPQTAPATRLSFATWPATTGVPLATPGERAQSPPFSDCSTLSSSSSALHSPFEPRLAAPIAIAGYPFPPASPRKPTTTSADDHPESPKTLPSLEMIQQRMARGRPDGVFESPTRSTFSAGGGAGAGVGRHGLPSFLLARKQNAAPQLSSSPPSSASSTGSFDALAALGPGGLKTPPMQDGPMVFVTPSPASL